MPPQGSVKGCPGPAYPSWTPSMALRGAVGGQHVVRSATKARRLPDPRSPGALSVVVPLPHCRGPQQTTPNNTQTVERTGVPTAPPSPSPQSTTGPGAVEPCDPTSVSASPHTPPPRPSPHTLARAGGGLGTVRSPAGLETGHSGQSGPVVCSGDGCCDREPRPPEGASVVPHVRFGGSAVVHNTMHCSTLVCWGV